MFSGFIHGCPFVCTVKPFLLVLLSYKERQKKISRSYQIRNISPFFERLKGFCLQRNADTCVTRAEKGQCEKDMSHPGFFKSSSNSPCLTPRGLTPCFLMMVKRKIENFSLHHHQKTCERGFFSHEKNPGWTHPGAEFNST